MRKSLLLLGLLLTAAAGLRAQTTCNATANLVLFTNYDGGVLNINVDVNIPNIKIGICSYEAVTVNLSGTYVGNVTAVRYAGYNSGNNTHCGSPAIATTTVTGAPSTATVNIVNAPSSPLSNSNGYPSIICGYSCSTTTNQGGCNTIDQIEAYFLAQFSGSVVRMHKAQYNCWSGTQAVSGGGGCCLTTAPPTPLSVTTSATAPTCNGGCNGTVTATASGGTPPYSYAWTGGPTTPSWSGRCAGTYTVTVSGGSGSPVVQNVTVTQPARIRDTITRSSCGPYFFNGASRTSSGLYGDTLLAANGCDSFLTLNLTVTNVNTTVTQSGATLTAAAGATGYRWFNCDSNKVIAGATAASYTAVKNGHYAVIVTQGNCSDTSACKTVSGLGLEHSGVSPLCTVFPNPTSGELNLQVAPALLQRAFSLTDGQGKIVLRGRFEQGSTVISIRHLPAGIYLLKAEGMEEPVRVEKR